MYYITEDVYNTLPSPMKGLFSPVPGHPGYYWATPTPELGNNLVDEGYVFGYTEYTLSTVSSVVFP